MDQADETDAMFNDLNEKLTSIQQQTQTQQRQLLRTIDEQWTQNNQHAAAIEKNTGQRQNGQLGRASKRAS